MQAILALEDGRIFRGKGLRRARRSVRRSRFQHRPHRLPGDLHRPLLRRADRRPDQSADRQLRHHTLRRRRQTPLHRRPRHPRVFARLVQLALHPGHRRVPRKVQRPCSGRGRHPRHRSPPAQQRRHARRHRTRSTDADELVARAKSIPKMDGTDLARVVSTKQSYQFSDASPVNETGDKFLPQPIATPTRCTLSPTTSASSRTSCAC